MGSPPERQLWSPEGRAPTAEEQPVESAVQLGIAARTEAEAQASLTGWSTVRLTLDPK